MSKDTALESIIFIHIPKTGGQTINSIFANQYQEKEIFNIDASGFNKSSEFRKLSQARKREIKIFKGHMFFGLHEYVPQQSTYITFLRDPVDRVISHYHYVRRTPTHYLYNEAKKMSLKDYIKSKISPELHNGQVRLIAGLCPESNPDQRLDIAKNNINSYFSVVGLTEIFDESLILMAKENRWKPPFYIKKNVTKSPARKESISKETLELILENHELDIELYKSAQAHFLKKINSLNKGNFERELKRFKQINKIYGMIHRVFFG